MEYKKLQHARPFRPAIRPSVLPCENLAMENTSFQNIVGVHMRDVFAHFQKAPFALFPSDYHLPTTWVGTYGFEGGRMVRHMDRMTSLAVWKTVCYLRQSCGELETKTWERRIQGKFRVIDMSVRL